MNAYWKEMYHKMPVLVTRKQIFIITGGLVSIGTLANKDCLGSGIKNKTRVGQKICYPRDSVIEWLMQQERSSVI